MHEKVLPLLLEVFFACAQINQCASMAWSDDNSSGGDAPREFDLCTGLAGLDEFLGLFGSCSSKAGSECNTTAQLLRWRHECRCTGEQRDCGEHTHVANVASNVYSSAAG